MYLPEDAGDHADGLLRILNRIPIHWGRWITCDKGWYPLIIELDERLAEIVPDYEIHQVKEKFGTLRYYIGSSDPTREMDKIITEFEDRSATICEMCSADAVIRVRRYWYKTLCDSCASTLGYDKQRDDNSEGE